jgi:hypothetical protein
VIVDKEIPNTAPFLVKKIRNPNWNRNMSVVLADYRHYCKKSQQHINHIGYSILTDEFLLRSTFSLEQWNSRVHASNDLLLYDFATDSNNYLGMKI